MQLANIVKALESRKTLMVAYSLASIAFVCAGYRYSTEKEPYKTLASEGIAFISAVIAAREYTLLRKRL